MTIPAAKSIGDTGHVTDHNSITAYLTAGAAGDATGTLDAITVAKVNGTSVPAAPTAGYGLRATSTTAAVWLPIPWTADPAANGFLGWSLNPDAAGSSSGVFTAGTVYVAKIRAEYDAVSATRTVWFTQTANATAATDGRCNVWDSTGVKLGSDSSNQSATWVTGAPNNRSVTVGSFAISAGSFYYISFLVVGSSLMTVSRDSSTGNNNINRSGATLKYASGATGLSASPASITPASLTTFSSAFFVGLS